MKGLIKLKVPTITVEFKLYIIVFKGNDGNQYRCKTAAHSLEQAISRCYKWKEAPSMQNYVLHYELTVEEINSLFKNL